MCWNFTLPHPDKCRGLCVDSASTEMSNGLLGLLIVGTLRISLTIPGRLSHDAHRRAACFLRAPAQEPTAGVPVRKDTNPLASISNFYFYTVPAHALCTHATH